MSLQPYVRNIALQNRRGLASAATAIKKKNEPAPPYQGREALKTSKVGETVVSTVETNGPVSRLAVYFRAGSRNETDATQGLSHMLRICAGLGTSGASQFGLSRSIEAAGGRLSCTSGREFTAYTLEATRENLSNIDKYLQDVAINQVFKPWEVKDNVPRLRLDRATRSQEVRLMELVHKTVFRKGLGYSIYSPKFMIGNHTSEMLSTFVQSNFLQAAVVGVGMPHEQAADFASRLNLKSVKAVGAGGAAFYSGQEFRKETNDRVCYVALAVEGASLADPKKAVAAALVQRALGASPRTGGSPSPNSKLFSAISDVETKTSATGFSASYSDSGVVGASIVATPKTVDSVVRKTADILRSAKFSGSDANRAKGILKGDLALADETGDSLIDYLGFESLFGKPLTLQEQMSLVDSVSPDDMNSILSGKKLSMAVFGNVTNVPYLDELK